LKGLGGLERDRRRVPEPRNLPFAHTSQAARDVMMEGAGFGDITADFCWVLGYTVVFFVLGVLCFRWKTKG
jgi:ABC-2 type transport system permease protein